MHVNNSWSIEGNIRATNICNYYHLCIFIYLYFIFVQCWQYGSQKSTPYIVNQLITIWPQITGLWYVEFFLTIHQQDKNIMESDSYRILISNLAISRRVFFIQHYFRFLFRGPSCQTIHPNVGDMTMEGARGLFQYRWISARLQYLQCISDEDTAVLH